MTAIILSCLGIWLLGCAASEENNPLYPEYGTPQPENRHVDEVVSYSSKAIVEYANIDFSDPGNIEKYAKARILVVPAPLMWDEGINEGAILELKAVNPDLKVVGYFNAHTAWLRWGDDEANTYQGQWFAATKPYWSFTTAGDTMMPWPGKVVLNILDPNCREAIVDVLADHWNTHANVYDGIFWDHFNEIMWVSDSVPGVEGDLDLDSNGIAHKSDPEEKQAYRDASVALIQRTREVLGDHVIQITNGNRAARDSVFANLVDGTMYENFPEVGFSGLGMRHALDLTNPRNLFAANKWPRTQNGGPYQILSNSSFTHYRDENEALIEARKAEFNRVVALLTGALAPYYADDQRINYGWPEIDVNLGEPVAQAEYVGEVISREFENGRVTLDLSMENASVPFGFEIEQDGEVIQRVLIPAME